MDCTSSEFVRRSTHRKGCPREEFLLAIVSLLGFVSFSPGDEPLKLDPQQPYSDERLNPVNYDIEFLVTVTTPSKFDFCSF